MEHNTSPYDDPFESDVLVTERIYSLMRMILFRLATCVDEKRSFTLR